MSASSEYDFSNFKSALKLNYGVYVQNSMTKCDNLNYFLNKSNMFYLPSPVRKILKLKSLSFHIFLIFGQNIRSNIYY